MEIHQIDEAVTVSVGTTGELRFVKGRLQQRIVRTYYLDGTPSSIQTEWVEVPSFDEEPTATASPR